MDAEGFFEIFHTRFFGLTRGVEFVFNFSDYFYSYSGKLTFETVAMFVSSIHSRRPPKFLSQVTTACVLLPQLHPELVLNWPQRPGERYRHRHKTFRSCRRAVGGVQSAQPQRMQSLTDEPAPKPKSLRPS